MTDDVVVWLRGVHEHAERVALTAAEVDPPPWTPALDREGEPYGNVTASPGGSRAYLEGALWNDEGAESLAMEPVTAVFVAENHPGAVLARVEAERAILAVVLPEVERLDAVYEGEVGPSADHVAPLLLAHLASGWKHMPGFVEGWTS